MKSEAEIFFVLVAAEFLFIYLFVCLVMFRFFFFCPA